MASAYKIYRNILKWIEKLCTTNNATLRFKDHKSHTLVYINGVMVSKLALPTSGNKERYHKNIMKVAKKQILTHFPEFEE